jgi:hypothetical protein
MAEIYKLKLNRVQMKVNKGVMDADESKQGRISLI